MGAKIQVLNGDDIKKALIAKLSNGLQPALEKAKERVEDKFKNNPPGWAPLAALTILDRRRKGYGPTPMLYRTGHLQGVAVQDLAVDSPTEGHISTTDPLAIIQNNGTDKIPGRSFYTLTQEDKTAIFAAFLKGITG